MYLGEENLADSLSNGHRYSSFSSSLAIYPGEEIGLCRSRVEMLVLSGWNGSLGEVLGSEWMNPKGRWPVEGVAVYCRWVGSKPRPQRAQEGHLRSCCGFLKTLPGSLVQ